jgi:RNA polymerase sigma-70 factor (ECF subfamily)
MVQATFIEVQRSAGRFDGRAAVGTWIVGIALNLARHHIRGESRRRSAMNAVAERHPKHDGRSPDDQAASRQMLARLQEGFDELPHDLRTVFALCDLEGMRGVDVAKTLRVPEGTIWRRLHEARVRLRARMNGAPR